MGQACGSAVAGCDPSGAAKVKVDHSLLTAVYVAVTDGGQQQPSAPRPIITNKQSASRRTDSWESELDRELREQLFFEEFIPGEGSHKVVELAPPACDSDAWASVERVLGSDVSTFLPSARGSEPQASAQLGPIFWDDDLAVAL
eukprot:TRINITY_DN49243_c0_g1_i1.p2 TRINITY_DN49243_c0_g1~~TRINITY_DN49243_c0_g1_i1.p2  ORF type:complete len:144 (+),score=28.47 TRINITY_DN49243_c0_g1_i1:45-476(+)